MTLPVVMIGAGALGLDVLSVHEALADAGGAPEIVGYLDDHEPLWGGTVLDYPVLGGLSWLEGKESQVEALITVGNCSVRSRFAAELRARGVALATWIHPTAVMTRHVEVGLGCILMGGASFTMDVRLGQNIVVNPMCTIGHEVSVGDHSYLSPSVNLTGRVTVGDEVFLGTGSTVIPGFSVGSRAVIGAGAVVIQDVEADSTVVGVPARAVSG